MVQIKPVPRKNASSATGYAAHVKAHFAEIKRSMPGASQKEVMEAVARKYRADKAASSKSSRDQITEETTVSDIKTTNDVNRVTRVLEFVTLEDD